MKRIPKMITTMDTKVKEAIKEKLYGSDPIQEPQRPLIEHRVPRPLFTQEMKDSYTILVPMMLPIHFPLVLDIFKQYGYNLELLKTNHRGIVEEGLRNVHNDTCYPALLVIGQLLDALKSGKYDIHKTALMITQTGGGCRASNYIHLLRKSLEKNNLGHVPVISLNMNNLESHPGFEFSKPMILKCMIACIYGDMVMHLANQCRPYEQVKGHTNKVIEIIINQLSSTFRNNKYLALKENFIKILNAFKTIKRNHIEKIKVGIVGEIYLKYAPLGNNNLETYLESENAEVVMTGVLDFFLYSVNNTFIDAEFYKKKTFLHTILKKIFHYIIKQQELMQSIIAKNSDFRPSTSFLQVQNAVKGYISQGVKMGEGWLLTGEMIDMVESGVNNIVCAQPFGCLPNHIVAKGMIRAIKNQHQDANIIAVDYDPGSTKANQENRIKLMLANAKAGLSAQELSLQPQPIVVTDYVKSNLA